MEARSTKSWVATLCIRGVYAFVTLQDSLGLPAPWCRFAGTATLRCWMGVWEPYCRVQFCTSEGDTGL